MLFQRQDSYRVEPDFNRLIEAAGLTSPKLVFTHRRIHVWRTLADRENTTLDVPFEGRTVRLHIKRYAGSTELRLPHLPEVRGHLALLHEQIPTAAMVGYGHLADRRCFTIFLDLAGYTPADKLIEAGTPFERLLIPTADLAAKLHNANLHHRDLYLCHFMAKLAENEVDLKLSDAARVARLNSPLTRRRWIIKDLAQFWYSTTKLPITDEQRTRWLARYAEQRRSRPEKFLAAVKRKAASIAKHDARLTAREPGRHISIPTGTA